MKNRDAQKPVRKKSSHIRRDDFIINGNVRDVNLDTGYKRKVIDYVAYNNSGSEEFLNISVSPRKILIFFLIVGVIMVILAGRITYLQVVKGSEYEEIAEGNRIRVETIKAPRGLIYDRNNNLLVKNVPNFIVTLTPGDLPETEPERTMTLERVSIATGIKIKKIKKLTDEANIWENVEIKEHLSYDEAIKLMIESKKLPGVKCWPQATREYIDPVYTSHVIGYLGRINEQEFEQYKEEDYALIDFIGKSGLEAYYEKMLRGINGKKHIEVDSLGNEIKNLAQKEPVSGDNLQLTLDLELQKKVYDTAEKYAIARESNGVVIIAMDPRNGDVLAIVSWPGFDTNKFILGLSQEDYAELIEDEAKPLFNKAISGEYPSGSTFKPVVAAAALQEGVINENTTVESTGGIQINKWYFPDWKDDGHGTTNVTKALAESVNTFFYIAGGGVYNEETNEIEGGLGIDRINRYARKFGLDAQTQIDIAGERKGFLPTKEWKSSVKNEDWYIGDTYHVAIGQGDILVTPIQVANYTTAIANGGTLYRPHLIKTVIGADEEIKEDAFEQAVNTGFVSSGNLEIVRRGMRDAVVYGSAKKLQDLPVEIAAKTGTAQHGGSDKNHSWLTAFAPYNSPEIVVTAIVEEGGEGTEAALPAVKEILDWYFNQ